MQYIGRESEDDTKPVELDRLEISEEQKAAIEALRRVTKIKKMTLFEQLLYDMQNTLCLDK